VGRRTPKARPPESRARGLLPIVVGGLVSVVGVVLLLASPLRWPDRAAYRAARPCGEAAAGDCVRVVPAVVERTRVKRVKADSYAVWLAVEGRTVRVELPVPDLVFPALHDGREVAVGIWKGEVARIEVPGVGVAETEDSPLVRSIEQPVFGLTAAVWGAFGAWYGMGQRRGEPQPEIIDPGRFAAVGLALVAFTMGTIPGFFQVVAFDVYDGWAYVATTALASLAFWGLLRLAAVRAARRR